MKNLKGLIIVCLLFISCAAFAQTTTIWVVRHAEKATTPANDPDLSDEGKLRTGELAKELKNQKVAAIFATPYKRTTQTGEPALKQAGLAAIKNYDPADLIGFAQQVLQDYAGREVLIVGHSNTIIPTLKAFGLVTNVSDLLDDDDYDMLYKLTVGTDKKVNLDTRRYGAAHHSNKAIPQNKMMMQMN
jgi:phosphohistidine phosphatase SixA